MGQRQYYATFQVGLPDGRGVSCRSRCSVADAHTISQRTGSSEDPRCFRRSAGGGVAASFSRTPEQRSGNHPHRAVDASVECRAHAEGLSGVEKFSTYISTRRGTRTDFPIDGRALDRYTRLERTTGQLLSRARLRSAGLGASTKLVPVTLTHPWGAP